MHKIIKVPPSKSVSNRVLVLAAFRGKGKIIKNILKCEDTAVMFEVYSRLGVKYEILQETEISVDIQIFETVTSAISEPVELFMNNSGTATRFLVPCLGLIKGEFVVDGVARMRERPIQDLIVAVRDLGVQIEYLGEEGFLPIKIVSGGVLTGVAKVKCDLSSQYLSGLKIAEGLSPTFKIELLGEKIVSKPYLDLTEEVVNQFFEKEEFVVENDYSSASYFIALGVLGDKSIEIEGLNPNSKQADQALITVLQKMGAKIEFLHKGGLLCSPSRLRALAPEINCEEFPDSAMTLVIICSLIAEAEIRLTGLSTLKYKECDRLKALSIELEKVGVGTVIDDDSITVFGILTKALKSAKIKTYNDHRMAMCFALLNYFNSEIEILNKECVKKTFPTFFNVFAYAVNA